MPQGSQNEIRDALAHAEALYYGARFSESITLLTRVDDQLRTQPAARLQDRVNTKLRLALSYIGMNDTAKAKALFIELYALDPDFVLDKTQYPPKVVSVATEARTEQTKIQCQAAQETARTYLETAKVTKLLDLLQTSKSKCSGLGAIESEAASAFYKNGLAEYRRNEFTKALSSFEATVALSPGHDLASQYIDVIQSKMQVGQDRLLLQWQRNFDTRQLAAAAADYRQILAFNDGRGTAAVNHVNGEYRKALAALVETWNRSCSSGDPVAMATISKQIFELLPEPSFGEDVRARMVPCPEPKKVVEKAPEPVVPDKAAPPVSLPCFEMQAQLALTRLKTRVDPTITNEMRQYLKNNPALTVRVKARISEKGDVSVLALQNGNPIISNAVRNAVSEWKFTPIRDNSGPRCVETEFPLVIKYSF